MHATIDFNRQYYDEKMKKLTEYLTEMITSIMDLIQISKSSSVKKYSPKAQNPTTVVPYNKNAPPLEGGHSKRFCGIWNLKQT